MARIVRVELNPTGFTYDVYSGTSVTGITDLVCSGVTNFCDFAISNSVSGSYIYIKLVSKDCKDQILEVFIGPPDCSFGVSIEEIITVVNIWKPETLCEKDNIFAIRKQFTGLCSPGFARYDPVTRRVYVVDYDNYLHPTQWGNIYWFDPVTATTKNDFTYYHGNSLTDGTQLRYNSLRNAFIDLVFRRIYIVGTNLTGLNGTPITTPTIVDGVTLGPINGLVVYDIDTNTHQTVLNYGSNILYQRDFLYVNDAFIYVNDWNFNRFIRINRNDFGNQTFIPITGLGLTRQRYLEQNPQIIQVSNNRLWLVSTGSGVRGSIPTTSNVGVFDLDFNFLGEIILPNVQLFTSGWRNCCFYRQSIFQDPLTNRVYVGDLGSSQRFVIQPDATFSSGSTIIFSEVLSGISENRVYAFPYWEIDVTNNDIYQNMILWNWENPNIGDLRTKFKVYKIDRNNFNYLNLFNNNNFKGLGLTNDGLSNSLIGVNTGLLWLNRVNDYNTDGQLTIYNNSIDGDNTGNVIINQLLEYNSVTNLPTGNVKPNDPNDPDYVLSPYQDTDPITGCPITFTLNCPTVLYGNPPNTIITGNTWTVTTGNTLSYELGFSTSTRLNPIISAISVTYIYNSTNITGGTITHFAPYNSNYLSGIFNNYTSGTYRIVVEYFSTTNTIIQSCLVT